MDKIVKRKSSQPPVTFERKAQVSGIAARYIFPCGRDSETYDIEVAPQFLPHDDNGAEMTARLRHTFNTLAQLNPEIGTLSHSNDYKKIRHIIFGAASSMNVDDIRYYIEYPERKGRPDVARASHGEVFYDRLNSAIERRTGVMASWVASPQTLKKIFMQVRNRPPVHPVQTPEIWRPKYRLRDIEIPFLF